MGFRYWYEGVIFVLIFGSIVALSCFFVTLFGTKMINDLGNFPTKVAKIQVNVLWKLGIVEAASFVMFFLFFRFFS